MKICMCVLAGTKACENCGNSVSDRWISVIETNQYIEQEAKLRKIKPKKNKKNSFTIQQLK